MQIRAERIDLAATPLPAAQPSPALYLVSVAMAGSTVRPRTVEFVVNEASARALWRLRESHRYGTRFAMAATGERRKFFAVEEVRFDHADGPYSVGDITRIARLPL